MTRRAQLTKDALELGHTWVAWRGTSGTLLYSGNNAARAEDWRGRWADVEIFEVMVPRNAT